MIIIKADAKLKTVFTRLIQTTKENVEWSGNFVVAGSNLILLGRVKSLFFNFETQKIHANLIDLVVNDEKTEQNEGNDVLSNVLNISMYAFGKWGKIAGLKVEKDYKQLNILFENILKEIGVSAELREESLKFNKNGIQIAFEEVVQEAVDWAKQGTEKEQAPPQEELYKQEYEVGLWHNLRWDKVTEQIRKSDIGEEDKNKSRFGRNFYMVNYCCPFCGEKLYMVVFPVQKEVVIETVEGKVFLARAYTCNSCFSFFTPRPKKLIAEGDLYCFHFEEDKKAYEDYADLLGEVGERCSNYKFNEFVADCCEEETLEPDSLLPEKLEELVELEELPLVRLTQIMEKMESGFYPLEETEVYLKKVEQVLEKKEKQAGIYQEREKVEAEIKLIRKQARQKKHSKEAGKNTGHKISQEKRVEQEPILGQNSNPERSDKSDKERQPEREGRPNQEGRPDQEGRLEQENKFEPESSQVKGSKIMQEETLESSPNTLAKRENEWRNKAKDCVGKPYSKINQIIREIKESEGEEEEKAAILFPLYEYRKKQAQKEAEAYLSKVPENVSKKLFDAMLEKLGQYEKEDILPWFQLLNAKRDLTERKEIGEFIKQTKAKDRQELWNLYQALGGQGFTEKNVKPYAEKIYAKVYEMDKAALHKICPEVMDLSFEKGLEVYQEIAKGVFLPELKTNTLDMIDKRLTKMKTDENGQLVKKLQKEIQKNLSDTTRIHFYDARAVMRGDVDSKEETLMTRAMGTYSNCKNKYEYPIMIADSSRFHNGKEGITITPDQIFFKTFMQEGSLKISEIQDVAEMVGRFKKGIQLRLKNGSVEKLPAVYIPEERKAFVKIFGEYISYLQEKPESHNIAYLVKDKHEVKCCIRCGYTYKGGSTCPKCGSKTNH